jgi:predicted 2-oxoglutarate/Fe(II)-dependent dioxygenase YbiX
MIKILSNVLSDIECKEFIDYYKTNADKIVENQSDNLYHFDMINIIDNMQEFSFIRKLNLTKSHIDSYFKIRIQNVNNQIDMVQTPHIHTPPYNFVVFLNDEFEGGELIINNLTIKPQRGQMVYFSWDEPHYVKNVSLGDRYTLVAFLNNAINLNKLESKLI